MTTMTQVAVGSTAWGAKAPERRLTDAFNALVSTGRLLDTFKQMIPILSYHARETVYRAGSDVGRVYNRQYVTGSHGELLSVSVTVELLREEPE